MHLDASERLPAAIHNIGVRSTRALIDLGAISENIRIIRQSLSAGTNVIAVVKANAYGHGALFIARAALAAGASMLGVAAVNEGIVLRRQGVRAPILVLGPADSSQYIAAVENGLTLAVNSTAMAAQINTIANESGRTAHVHLKIDTGMHRYGCNPDDAAAIASSIAAMPQLWLEGVFTHFATADEVDESATLAQAERFDQALDAIATAGVPVQIRHAANSAATIRSRRYDYDAIRLGIAMYGLAPSEDVPLLPGMTPALKLVSRIAQVSNLQAGETVSYGGTYVATDDERIALIPCGYADGYRRSLSNAGSIALGDELLPVRGRVCMDQLIVGILDGVSVAPGDQVTLIGTGDDAAPTATELAASLGTINYEIGTSISARVPRVYMRNGQIVAVDDLTGPLEIPATQEYRGH